MSLLLRLAVFSLAAFGSLRAALGSFIGLMFSLNESLILFTYLRLLCALLGVIASLLAFIKLRVAGIMLSIAALGILIFSLTPSILAGERPEPPGHASTPPPLEERIVVAFKRAIPAVVPMAAASGLAFWGTRRREPPGIPRDSERPA